MSSYWYIEARESSSNMFKYFDYQFPISTFINFLYEF